MSEWDENSISSYQQPLNLVPEHQVDQYVSILEEVLTDYLDELNEPGATVFWRTEQETYESILESLEDVEDKMDLYNVTDQAVHTESVLPAPLGHLDVVADSKTFLKSGYTEEILDEAQQLLGERTRTNRNNP